MALWLLALVLLLHLVEACSLLQHWEKRATHQLGAVLSLQEDVMLQCLPMDVLWQG